MSGDVFPRAAPRSTTSRGEIAIWEALRRCLPAGWRAWHSLRLRLGNRWEGEGDFVIASPDRGLLVLEVKSGRIELRDGHWYQNGHILDRAPRQQGLDFVRKLVDALRTRQLETPPFGVACAFPDVEFSDGAGPRAGDVTELVIGARQLEWLEHALPPLLAKAIPDRDPPRSRRWIDVLHELWGETWVPALRLCDEAQDSEARVVALVDDQLDVLAAAEDNRRALVTGGAGTGKTLLARELCTRAAARGQRVLYLCFTEALGYAVERSFAAAQHAGARVRAAPIRRFAAMLLEASGAQVAPGDPTFWQNASLAAAVDALPPLEDRPELVVVDEAQDLEPGDWDLIGELVGDRALWILADERQAFWRRPPIPDALLAGAVRLKLAAQHRAPSRIASFAAGYVAPEPPRRPGEASSSEQATGAVRMCVVPTGREADRLGAELVELLRAGARPTDIAVVSLAGVNVSQVLQLDTLGGQRLVRADSDAASEHVIADSFLRFKGLERPFVIVCELAAGHASQYERRMYIAATRATSRLLVIATDEDVARDPQLARLTAG